jgi:DNA-binding HxlR family transcriptional regulator
MAEACMIQDEGRTICIDPTLPLLHLLGRKYSMLVIGVLSGDSQLQFNRIVEAIPYSNATIISKTLKELSSQDIVRKDSEGENIRYSLTPFGKEVRRKVLPLIRFVADQYSTQKST